MPKAKNKIVVIGAGIAGLSCARHLHQRGIAVEVLEAASRPGGRIKTDEKEGYRLDRGFQVLQTAYPEARRVLDYRRLRLRSFAPGAVIRHRGRFYTVADPLRRPQHLFTTLTAPIGTLGDRLRLLRLAVRVARGPLEALFDRPEMATMDFLRAEGFSEIMIGRFFVPFFGGVCLDPRLRASSRVFAYVLRMFATGDAALPQFGMGRIPEQIAADLPPGVLRTGIRVRAVEKKAVVLTDGKRLAARAVVLATEAPEVARFLGRKAPARSVAETCLYFACDRAQEHSSYLTLNGDGAGPINNVVFPSRVSPAYAPPGKSLAAAVIIGMPAEDDIALVKKVRQQLADWFGPRTKDWRLLETYRITHALPDQSPPTPHPERLQPKVRPGIYVCGEYGSLPGIQWALVSGRRAAEAVRSDLG
jgi:phytoene dehydrogenase-like protein